MSWSVQNYLMYCVAQYGVGECIGMLVGWNCGRT